MPMLCTSALTCTNKGLKNGQVIYNVNSMALQAMTLVMSWTGVLLKKEKAIAAVCNRVEQFDILLQLVSDDHRNHYSIFLAVFD